MKATKVRFYKLYIHRDHLLLIDLLLNHIPHITNMSGDVQLAKELKEVISQALRRIPKIYEISYEDNEIND